VAGAGGAVVSVIAGGAGSGRLAGAGRQAIRARHTRPN